GHAVRGQPGLLLAERTRHRVRSAAMAARARRRADGLLPDRPGHSGACQGAAAAGAALERDTGAARVGVVAVARGHRDPEGRAGTASARQPCGHVAAARCRGTQRTRRPVPAAAQEAAAGDDLKESLHEWLRYGARPGRLPATYRLPRPPRPDAAGAAGPAP